MEPDDPTQAKKGPPPLPGSMLGATPQRPDDADWEQVEERDLSATSTRAPSVASTRPAQAAQKSRGTGLLVVAIVLLVVAVASTTAVLIGKWRAPPTDSPIATVPSAAPLTNAAPTPPRVFNVPEVVMSGPEPSAPPAASP